MKRLILIEIIICLMLSAFVGLSFSALVTVYNTGPAMSLAHFMVMLLVDVFMIYGIDDIREKIQTQYKSERE